MLGNPLLDVSVDAGQDLFDKYGLKNGNAIMAEEPHKPIYDELKSKYKPEFIAGGAAQNSARVAAWMHPEESVVAYIGAVGKDEDAKTLEKEATKAGLDVHYMHHEDKETGSCAVLIKDHDRSMVANLAAAEHYHISHLKSADITPVWTSAQTYYMAGFFLTHSHESAMFLAEHAHAEGKTFTLNLAAPFVIEVPIFRERLVALLPYVDVLFGNEVEAATLGKVMEWGDDLKVIAQKAAAHKKHGKRARHVVITQGKDHTLVATHEDVKEIPVPPVPKEKIVDTNGAGDSFVGGFLAAHALGHDAVKSAHAGHHASGIIIQTAGTQLHGDHGYKW